MGVPVCDRGSKLEPALTDGLKGVVEALRRLVGVKRLRRAFHKLLMISTT